MAWVPKWRERVIGTEDSLRSTVRSKNSSRIDALKRKQLKLSQKISWHEEEYDRGAARCVCPPSSQATMA
jgi:hypothetical protein